MMITWPRGAKAPSTALQNRSNRSSGTCASQCAKKTASHSVGGFQLNRSACTVLTLLRPRWAICSSIGFDPSRAVTVLARLASCAVQ